MFGDIRSMKETVNGEKRTKSAKKVFHGQTLVVDTHTRDICLAISPGCTISDVPAGRPTSGRTWKAKQISRSSTLHRSGVMSHLNKTFEEKKLAKEKLDRMKAFEREIKEDKKRKAEEEKERRMEREKRRQQNEYKNSVYQVINPEKLKGMSKKQLRQVRKTSVNSATGQVELIDPFTSSKTGMKKKK